MMGPARAAGVIVALAGVMSAAACGGAAAGTGPSEATIKTQVEKYYGIAFGNEVFQFQSIQVGKPRKAHLNLGIPEGTTVWPVLTKFTTLHGKSDIDNPSSVCSRNDISQYWLFFKNEFGDWGDGPYANSENYDHGSRPYSPCSTMPGAEGLRGATK